MFRFQSLALVTLLITPGCAALEEVMVMTDADGVLGPATSRSITSGCLQEGGVDTGGTVEEAGRTGYQTVRACIGKQDRHDGFLVRVPATQGAMVLSLQAQKHDVSIFFDIYDANGGKLGYGRVNHREQRHHRFNARPGSMVFVKTTAYQSSKVVPYFIRIRPDVVTRADY